MIKKILKIIGVILLLIILAAIPLIIMFFRDPGFYLRLLTEKISVDQVVEASYTYDFENSSETKAIPGFYFKPSESGTYTISAFDLESSSEVYITMTVVDNNIDAYFTADNRKYRREWQEDTVKGSTVLQASKYCYILFTVEPRDEDLAQFSGSFKVTVTKGDEDEGPPQLTTEEPVVIQVGAEGQACAAFVPPETGYYRFEHSIVSRDASKGFSGISSITSSDKIKVGLTGDICRLQKDKEYFVWVTANETDSKKSKIKLSCMPVKTEKANGICSVDITGDSVIEYFAEKDCDLAVYTVSAGDPKLVIYETAGLPLRTDDKSETSLSDNPDDIATVLRVKSGTGLHICIFGDVNDCHVFITEYKGDGTTLTIDDLVPVPEIRAEEAEQPEEQEEENNQVPDASE